MAKRPLASKLSSEVELGQDAPNPPPALTRAEATRARLVDAAVAEFSIKGFHGTSTRDIASAAGMSPASLYIHHRSKEDLLYEIATVGHEKTLRILAEAAGGDGDPVTKFKALVRGYVLHHLRDHTMARVINYEMNALTEEHLSDIRQIRRKIDRFIYESIEAGVSSGDFHTPDPRMTAVALESMGIDIARWFEQKGHWTPDEIADRYVAMALRLVGAE